MNKGLLVGQVLDMEGNGVSGAIVALSRVTGEADMFFGDDKGKKPVYASANKYGRFRIKFQWMGPDFGDAYMGPYLRVTAWSEVNSRQGLVYTSQVTAKQSQLVRSFLVKNVLEMTQSGISTFKAKDGDIEDFAEELINFGMGLLSTESYLLVAGTYIYIR